MRKISLTISIVAVSLQLGGCSHYLNTKSATEKRVDLIVSGAYKKYENREVVFERLTMEFTNYQEPPVVLTTESTKDSSRLEADGTQINTLFDGFGNKTETRIFFNDPLIKFVVVRTTPAGEKKAFVYGQNGEVKLVSDELLDDIMTVPTSEIARSVQIAEGRKENEYLAGLQKKQAPRPVPINTADEVPALTPADAPGPNSTDEKVPNNNKAKTEFADIEKP